MRNFVFVAIYFLLSLQAKSQETPSDAEIPTIIPPTPNAASLGNYGNIPIGLYTGQPNISFPLYTISYNDISVPIALSYNYSGLKVEEYPSWVGTGWTLTGTGVITRQVRGLPDETTAGYNGSERNGEKTVDFIENGDYSSQYIPFLNGVMGGYKDSEPDMFVLSMPGHSAKFFFDEKQCNKTIKQAIVIPHQKLKVIGYFNYAGIYNIRTGIIEKFEVTNGNGVVYTFDITEKAAGVEPGDPDEDDFANSWYLSKIVTPNGNEITYQYADRILDMPPTLFERRDIPLVSGEGTHVNPGETYTIKENYTSTNEKILSKILFRNGVVDFVEGDERLDWNFYTPQNKAVEQPRSLSKIRILLDGKIAKEIDFAYSYFGTEARLRLDSFQEKNGLLTKPPYRFNYKDGLFPPIGEVATLFQQDHWGYYLGSYGTYNNTLIPPFNQNFQLPNGSQLLVNVPGNQRTPNHAAASSGILEKIIYPTGGSTQFEYEPNEYWGSTESQFNLCSGTFLPTQNAKASLTTFGNNDETKQFTVLTPTCMKINYNINAPCIDGEAGVNISYDGSTFLQHIVSNKMWGMDYIDSGPGEDELFTLQPGTYTISAWVINENSCGQSTTAQITFYQIIQNDCQGDFMPVKNASTSFVNGIDISDTEEFIVTDMTCLKVQYSLYAGCNNSEVGVKLLDSDGNQILYHHASKGASGVLSFTDVGPGEDELFSLSPGTYTISAFGTNNTMCGQIMTAAITVFQIPNNPLGFANLNAGGLRIKSVRDCDLFESCVIKNYHYKDVDNPSRSSGVLTNPPVYFYLQSVMWDQNATPAYIGTAQSYVPIATTSGGAIGYKNVTIVESPEGLNGRSVHRFSTANEFPDEGSTSYPFPPIVSNDWKRGSQLYSKVYGDSLILSEQSSEYCETITYNGQIAIKLKKVLDYRSGNYTPTIYDYAFIPYNIKSGILNFCEDHQTSYSYLNGVQQSLTTQKNMFYENPDHLQVTRIETTNSKGEVLKATLKYVEDVNTVSGLSQQEQLGISSHQNKMAVIEEQQYNGPNLLTTKRSLYANQRMKKVQFATGNNPLEDYVNYNAYDHFNNVLNYTTRTGENKSYIWDVNGMYPLVEAVNANHTDIFFTSFEFNGQPFVDGSGNNKAISGTRVWNTGSFTFPVSFMPSDPANTLMSYWYWQDNQWNFSGEIPYASNIVTGATKLDEVRAFPKGAQLTTLTYEPGVGANGITDANNQSMHYEYDLLGRLQFIRDHDGNILKEFKYHYQEQE